MNGRLKEIFSAIPQCKIFADIGCDHGYIAKAVLDFGRSEKVIISDVSAKCLEKANALLKDYILCGKAESVVSDGFDKIGYCDAALIAGIGGEEIVSILGRAENLPQKLVLQPMKNCDKVRLVAVERGYKILKDCVFESGGKFYDLIICEKGEDALTEEEVFFGRTNLINRPEAFVRRTERQIEKLKGYLAKGVLSKEDESEISEKIERLSKYV